MMRRFLVIAGSSILYYGLLFSVHPPAVELAFNLPPVPLPQNIPYFIYIRAWHGMFGLHPEVVLAANGLLVLLTGWLAYRLAAGLTEQRYRVLAGLAALVLYLASPLALTLPATLGYLGGSLLVPFAALLFLNGFLISENWSVFMRAVLLAVLWSLFLWVHLPAALLVLAALVPWVLYNRRPLPALGTLLTIATIGTLLFSLTWIAGCALAQRWSLMQGPVDTVRSLWNFTQQGLAGAWNDNPGLMDNRLSRAASWISPFLLLMGLQLCGRSLWRLIRERRSRTLDVAVLLSLAFLAVVVGTAGKVTLPGVWYVLILIALWAPLVAMRLGQTESVYSRGYRITAAIGFFSAGLVLALLRHHGGQGTGIPGAWDQVILVLATAVAGVAAYILLRRNPLTLENRFHALLLGATLAYFLVIDGSLLAG